MLSLFFSYLQYKKNTEWKMSEKMIISTVTEKINGKNVVIPIQKIDISNVKSISIPRYDERKLILKPVTYILNTEYLYGVNTNEWGQRGQHIVIKFKQKLSQQSIMYIRRLTQISKLYIP
eukprot:151555_1